MKPLTYFSTSLGSRRLICPSVLSSSSLMLLMLLLTSLPPALIHSCQSSCMLGLGISSFFFLPFLGVASSSSSANRRLSGALTGGGDPSPQTRAK